MTLITFLQLQISKIQSKPTLHASGPVKPSMTDQESGSKP